MARVMCHNLLPLNVELALRNWIKKMGLLLACLFVVLANCRLIEFLCHGSYENWWLVWMLNSLWAFTFTQIDSTKIWRWQLLDISFLVSSKGLGRVFVETVLTFFHSITAGNVNNLVQRKPLQFHTFRCTLERPRCSRPVTFRSVKGCKLTINI